MRENATMTAKTGFDEVDFHRGEALFRIAAHYPKLLEVILEEIQNALDANAKRIWLTVNFHNRTINIRDNGDGVTQDKFAQALTSVCYGIKPDDKLGRFGIGLISPLGKCERFLFASTPKSDPHLFQEWLFEPEKIRAQKDKVLVPRKNRGDLWYGQPKPHGTTKVPWRTRVLIEGFKRDSALSRVDRDTLTESVLDRYNKAMSRHGTVISAVIVNRDGEKEAWEVHAKEYKGTKLAEVTVPDVNAGNTYFKLYLAKRSRPKGQRQGRVLMGEFGNDFRLEFSTFSRTTPEDYLPEEAAVALKSGIFEGEILTSKAKLMANRRGFEPGDTLLGLCAAIDEWYQECGKLCVAEAQEERREQRYQELGLRSMKLIESLLKEERFSHLFKIIDSFNWGTVGVGHTDVSERSISSQEEKATATQGNPGQPREPKRELDGGRQEPQQEHTGHHPFSVLGPKGKKRTLVRSNSIGLQFSYEGMESSMKLWELDTKAGILYFNTRHKLWEMCEAGGDRALMRFQEYIAINALVLQCMPPETKGWVELGFEEILEPYVYTLIYGDALAGRQPGKRPPKLQTEKV